MKDMDLNGLIILLLLIRIGIRVNLIMLQRVLMQAIPKVASQWDGDIPMNEDYNGGMFNVITGNHYISVNEVTVN